jgi:hypothetical protein
MPPKGKPKNELSKAAKRKDRKNNTQTNSGQNSDGENEKQHTSATNSQGPEHPSKRYKLRDEKEMDIDDNSKKSLPSSTFSGSSENSGRVESEINAQQAQHVSTSVQHTPDATSNNGNHEHGRTTTPEPNKENLPETSDNDATSRDNISHHALHPTATDDEEMDEALITADVSPFLAAALLHELKKPEESVAQFKQRLVTYCVYKFKSFKKLTFAGQASNNTRKVIVWFWQESDHYQLINTPDQ